MIILQTLLGLIILLFSISVIIVFFEVIAVIGAVALWLLIGSYFI